MNMENEEGISEIVGSVLLIALAVVGVAIVAVLLFSVPLAEGILSVSLTAGTTADGTLVLIHEGGDPLEAGTYRVYVDTGNGPIDQTDRFLFDGDGAWSLGEALTYTDGEPNGRVIVTALVGGRETVIAEPRASGVITAVVDEGGNTPGPGPGPGDISIEITEPSDGGLMIFSGHHPQYSSTVRARVTGGTVKSVMFNLTGDGLSIEGTYTAEKDSDGEYYKVFTTNYGQLHKMIGRDVTIKAVAYDDTDIEVAEDTATVWIGV